MNKQAGATDKFKEISTAYEVCCIFLDSFEAFFPTFPYVIAVSWSLHHIGLWGAFKVIAIFMIFWNQQPDSSDFKYSNYLFPVDRIFDADEFCHLQCGFQIGSSRPALRAGKTQKNITTIMGKIKSGKTKSEEIYIRNARAAVSNAFYYGTIKPVEEARFVQFWLRLSNKPHPGIRL